MILLGLFLCALGVAFAGLAGVIGRRDRDLVALTIGVVVAIMFICVGAVLAGGS